MGAVSLPPGFRFHPTDEELVAYYLKRKINGHNIELDIIPQVDLYKCEPWDLPGKALLPSKDLEWYFFSRRDRKYPNGSRTNRATESGYWKATGKDRKVNSQKRPVGMKKTLVYHRGRAPHGARTGWIMHEYRLDQTECEIPSSGLHDVYALCRVFKKCFNGPKFGENYATAAGDNRSWYGETTESSNFAMARLSPSIATCSSSMAGVGDGSPFNITGTSGDHNWMHYLSSEEEALCFHNPSDPNYGIIPQYLPSKVDVSVERARLQHVVDSPQSGYVNLQMLSHVIPGYANHLSQDRIDDDTFSGFSDEFPFLPQNDEFQDMHSSPSTAPEDDHQNIGDFGGDEYSEHIEWLKT